MKTPSEPTYVIDRAGNLWHWNCGWTIKGRERTMRPLGHKTFATVPVATAKDIRDGDVTVKDRPGELWRRHVKESIKCTPQLMEHQLYGHCHIILTDGVHAIIRVHEDNGVKTCHFTNLSEVKFKAPRAIPADRKPRAEVKLNFTIDELCHPRTITLMNTIQDLTRSIERNDCSVRAYAQVLGLDYEAVRTTFAACGRKRGGRTEILTRLQAHKLLGVEQTICHQDKVGQSIQTLRHFIGKGRYLVHTSGHHLAIIDEEIRDWSADRNLRVKAVYTLTLLPATPTYTKWRECR